MLMTPEVLLSDGGRSASLTLWSDSIFSLRQTQEVNRVSSPASPAFVS